MRFLVRALMLAFAFMPLHVSQQNTLWPPQPSSHPGGRQIDAAAALTSVNRRLAAARAGVTPTMTAEYPASDPVLVPAFGSEAPVVASNGNEYLVVWEDLRRGSFNVYAARVDLTGKVLDPTGFVVSAAQNEQVSPAVAWTGRVFLVVWSDARNATTYNVSGWTRHDIYAARVSPSGQVLDSGGIAIAGAPSAQLITPAIAWDGVDALVAWAQLVAPGRAGWDLQGARITATGARIGRTFAVSNAVGNQFAPSVAWGGPTTSKPGTVPRGNFLVAWEDVRPGADADIYETRVGARGAPPTLGQNGTKILTYYGLQFAPKVAWNPKQPGWLVVWTDRSSTVDAIYGARVDSTGSVLDQNYGLPIAEYNDPTRSPAVSVTNVGAYVVSYARWENNDSTEIDEVRISTSGTVEEATRTEVGGPFRGAGATAIVTAGTTAFVAWSSSGDVLAARLTNRTGRPGASVPSPWFVLSKTADPQVDPAVAWNGSNYLVAWARAPSTVYVARVTSSGTILDGSGIAVTTTANLSEPIAVTSNGHDFLVTWTDTRLAFYIPVIYAARISAAGVNLDAGGIRVSGTGSYGSAAASDGSGYLVVSYRGSPANGLNVYGTRLGADGILLDQSDIPISTGPGNQAFPRVAWNGDEFLVVWQDNADVSGARVQDGHVLDASGIAIEAGPLNEQTPDVASDGQSFLVGWKQDLSNSHFNIFAARVGDNGALLDQPATKVASSVLGRPAPALAWTGSAYVIAWRSQAPATIAAAALGPGGTILGNATASAAIPTIFGGSDIRPVAAAGGAGGAVVAYAYRADEPRYGGVTRVFVRFVH